MSISLAFSGAKPCCKNKACKNAISCKFNNIDVGTNKDISGELTADDPEGSSKIQKCNLADGSKCAKSTKKAWWKFWVKKSTKNCTCKQPDATKASTKG